MDEHEKTLVRAAIRNGAFDEMEPIDVLLSIRGGAEIAEPERTVYSWFLSYLGEWDAARKVALSISDPDERGQALAVLAQRLTQEGLLEDAKDAIRLMGHASQGTGSFTEALQARLDLSAKVAEAPNNENLDGELSEIEIMIGQRNRTDALQAAFLEELARIWLVLGHKEKCVELLDQGVEVAKQSTSYLYETAGVSDVDSWQVLVGIARTLVSISEVERARGALSSISDAEYRNRRALKLGGDLAT